MTDKPKKKKKKNLIPVQKPNYQMWVIIVLLLLVFGITYITKTNSAQEITQKRFEDMYLSHDVKDVNVIINERVVEVTLKDEALQNEKYKDLVSQRPMAYATSPHYQFKIISPESFKAD